MHTAQDFQVCRCAGVTGSKVQRYVHFYEQTPDIALSLHNSYTSLGSPGPPVLELPDASEAYHCHSSARSELSTNMWNIGSEG